MLSIVKMKKISVVTGVLASLLLSQVAQAHPRWVLPSHFSVSKEGGDWLTVDVTASHGTFVFDKPAGSQNALVIMPDGSSERPNFTITGKRRSMFDFFFVEPGTHKITVNNPVVYYTEYKAGRRDTLKWVKANKADRVQLLPEKARDISTQASFTRAESYITVGKPSSEALKIEGKLLELLPITHPADIVQGESVQMQFYFEGEIQANVIVEITREGTLYRNHQEQIDLISDKDGMISFIPEHAGRYILKAKYSAPLKGNLLAEKSKSNVHLTFEAILQ
ncbi:MAG: DUF4198 domain-containing protein [Psychromonas sp.]|nr:DUF4198 domain-containing protein [Alteromonadales bacterium]MCP5078689.1 DUF4198 domain-containing protein [Psychromonas sp.]